MNCASGIAFKSRPPRPRGATAFASTSLSPMTSVYGIFASSARRMRAPIFSFVESSNSTRNPAARSSFATPLAYSSCFSEMVMTRACTGAIHPNPAANAASVKTHAGTDGTSQIYGFHTGGVNTLMGDGSVRFLRSATPIATLAALVSRNGGETSNLD